MKVWLVALIVSWFGCLIWICVTQARLIDNLDRQIEKLRTDIVETLKEEYIESDIVMSEFLRTCDTYLTPEEKRRLLTWSGDDKYMKVMDNGEIVRK